MRAGRAKWRHWSPGIAGGSPIPRDPVYGLKKTAGTSDGEALIAAAKGLSWKGPREPVPIDTETRDIVQTIYIRKVEKVGNDMRKVEFDKVEKVKDPVKAAMKKQ
jgi:branched-chain amino acid transport system substrate-binding protein